MRLPRTCGWLSAAAIAAAAVAAAVGLACHLELQPDATNRLRDDAFYEFTWAANVAAGRGPMVSDGVSTSGVQLLWSLLLVPVAYAFGAAALPVLAPWLGFALHVATAALWWGRTRDRVTAWCLGLCWLGQPLLVRESQNGQETALACLCLSALWLARRGSGRWFTVLAVLAVLARSDLLGLLVAVSVWRYGCRDWRWLLAPGLALGAHVGTNLALGGSWLPDSALPMAWLWHSNLALADPGSRSFWAQSWWFTRPVVLGGPWALASAMGLGFAVFAALRGVWPAGLRAVPALVVGCASALGVHDLATAGWAALFLALFPATEMRALHRGRTLMLLGAASILVLHWAVRWYPRDYYAAPLVFVALAALQPVGRWRLLLLLFAVAQIQDHRRIAPEALAGQEEMVIAGRFLVDVLPDGLGVGCFNSGLVTFHANVDVPAAQARRRIWNLDGVVDARAFTALRERRLGRWLDEQGVPCLLDNAAQFALDPRLPHASGHWFGEGFRPDVDLVELARFDVPGIHNGRPGGDSMRLYWRRGRGEPPARPSEPRDLGPAPRDGRYVLWPARAGQVLEAEVAPGRRQALLAADADTTAVLRVTEAQLGTGRLFVRGAEQPLLVLPRL
ncbi:MAG: hypothetical protein JNM25_19015 [Planctomycetes bacterium]|nr:hypothetical protein [Planctomycetota bacterium]